ncbi:hypothetical protein SteCoe_22097 [Stentor coeruleus]|uniref:Uncharacterized protein n=1 Tax=Stentor coeruleus TaxID=5963 RepID=A0A1R2BMX0_9CILI|nr:hypothetical protein SteCoe_22097 [Stentor coeruleus]
MNSTIKLKKKLSPLSQIPSEPLLSKTSLKKKTLSASRSDNLDTKDHKKFLTLQDPKLIHNINLQIPFVHSPSISISNSQKETKKSACIQGFTSNMLIKPSPRNIKKKKYARESEKPKLFNFDNFDSNAEKNNTENKSQDIRYLEVELKKALEENKELRYSLQEETVKDDAIEEMMKSFKSRLYKILYE